MTTAKLPGYLGQVEEVRSDHAVLRNKVQGLVYLPVSACSSFFSGQKSAAAISDLRKLLNLDEWIFYESVRVFQGAAGCQHQAIKAHKTVRGVAKISQLKRGHGFIANEEFGEIFFAGAVVTDDFLGLHDLEKSFRVGDEVNFIAWNQAGIQGTRNFKAEEISVPIFITDDPQRKHFGFVTRVLPRNQGAVLFSKSLGAVILRAQDTSMAGIRSPIEAGQRFKFVPGTPDFSDPMTGNAQFMAVNAQPYQGYMRVQIGSRGGFGPPPKKQPVPVRAVVQKVESQHNQQQNKEEELEFDEDWLDDVEKELAELAEEESREITRDDASSALVELPVDEMIDRVTLLDRAVNIPEMVDQGTQTDQMMEERIVVERLLNDEEVLPLIVQKFPGIIPSLMS